MLKKVNTLSNTHHTAQVFVSVQSGEVLLLATVERRVRQVDLGGEVVVEVLVVSNRIVLFGCVHDLQQRSVVEKR